MWDDIETAEDLLNFQVIADTTAKIINDRDGEPISIGISGGWGTGKSSLVKMIHESLENIDGEKAYIFIKFNAWLYQGYDDARMALLQQVADKILAEIESIEDTEKNQFYQDKMEEVYKRIDLLRVAKFATPIAMGTTSLLMPEISGLFGAMTTLLNLIPVPSKENLANPNETPTQLSVDPDTLSKLEERKSIPKEIEHLRSLFQKLLKELNLTLVVLVDDLDRCLPETAISTLEAMRLLLFVPKMAFIIAADEEIIRNSLRSRFGDALPTDSLTTSYFDKIIQIPIKVPRLGTNEVKGYLVLLLADLARRKEWITEAQEKRGYNAIIEAIKKPWTDGLTEKAIREAYGNAGPELVKYIELAEQLAHIMATSSHIAGNPRLIKRFLNDLIIRNSIAETQKMSVNFEDLVKIQLFERCASSAAFEFFAQQISESSDGKPQFLKDLEEQATKEENFEPPHPSWGNPFIREWLKLNPQLADVDLRPLLYLSRDQVGSPASFDELSPKGRELLEALCQAQDLLDPLIRQIEQIEINESEKILTRMIRRARREQWEPHTIIQATHLPKAFSELSDQFIEMLNEIPPAKRPVHLIPYIQDESWAEGLLANWETDRDSPRRVKNAIAVTKGDD